MNFQLNGEPFQAKHESITVVRMKGLLDSLPDEILINTSNLCDKLNLKTPTVLMEIKNISDYTTMFKGKRVYGNKKTIEEFQKQYGR
jgi:hypothetical protein